MVIIYSEKELKYKKEPKDIFWKERGQIKIRIQKKEKYIQSREFKEEKLLCLFSR
jgi:hypothetical protein